MFFAALALVSLAIAAPSFSSAHPLSPRANAQKYVVAHFMVGNTYPYTVQDWSNDIALASSSGIDAFALNLGGDSWQSARVADAYTAATGTGFKLFFSFDMTSLPCASPADASVLVNYVKTYSTHPNQFKYPPASPSTFVSTFSGEQCTFGQSSPPEGWKSQFKDMLTGQNEPYFVPSFFITPSDYNGQYGDTIDGGYSWNAAWPASTTTQSLSDLLNSVGSSLATVLYEPSTGPGQQAIHNLLSSLDSDNQYINALGGKTYMAAISPWFFTHYSPQTYNKNWIYLADTLYPSRWTSLIGARDQMDIAQVITWNDYGESHYIGPIDGAQPNSQAWVNGYDHTAWLDLTNYFATAFKTGVYPTITYDKIFLWARPAPKDANSPDSVSKPNNYEMAQDAMFAVVLCASPATVTLATNSTGSQSFSVPAGMSQLQLPLTVGGGMSATISRGGQTVVQLAPQGYTFNANPPSYNFNVFVAMATSTSAASAFQSMVEPSESSGSSGSHGSLLGGPGL